MYGNIALLCSHVLLIIFLINNDLQCLIDAFVIAPCIWMPNVLY